MDEMKHQSSETDRTISESSQNSSTVIKYITPRVISSRVPTSYPGSLNSLVDTNHSPITTTHGLATLNPNRFSTIPAIHSIDGERMIDEFRELSLVTETLAKTILDYCKLLAHNRAQELHIEWLNDHSQENRSVIEKIFRREIENVQKLLAESLVKKSMCEMKFNETSQTTENYNKQYKQLLAKRTQSSRELFDFERQIAQNNAEAQFLKRRIHHFDDQMKFYLFKNHLLHERKARLRYELDQEIFSHQSLKMELEILENDKITREDIHSSTLDDLHHSLDFSQLETIRPSKSFSQQLTQEVQRIRDEYEKKIEIYREELHRQFELELYRYQIQKSNSLPTVTREHQFKLEQYQREKNDVLQQTDAVRRSIDQIMLQMESLKRQIQAEKTDQPSMCSSKKQLENLNQLIKDRERQLEDILRIRTSLKDEIADCKKRVEYYSVERTEDKRASIQELNHHQSKGRSTSRLSLQEPLDYTEEKTRSLPSRNRSEQRKRHVSVVKFEDIPEEGTLARFVDFNVNQDCDELHRFLSDSNIDEGSIARILCNRSIGQRLQIREKYKNLFHQNLGDILETLPNQNLNQLLRILLLSPIEFDCFELRRILKSRSNDMKILAEIIFTRSNKHLQVIRSAYQTLFKSTLEDDILNEENSSVQQIYFVLFQSNRLEDNTIEENEIVKDVRELHQTQSTWRTDKSTFLRLLCTRSNSQLKSIFLAYQQCNGTEIDDAIRSQTDGHLLHTLLTIVQILRSTPQYFANELKNNFQSAALSIHNLNRVIVSRCEIDMVQIKNEYEKLLQHTLYDHIQSNTSGTYKQALLELIRHRNSSGVTFRYPVTRSSNDRQRSEQYRNPSFDSHNQGKNGSLATITTHHSQTNHHHQQRTFVRLSATRENHYDEF